MYRGHVPSIKADDDERERVVSVLVSDRAIEKRAKKVYVVCIIMERTQ